jgi:putative acetyltransferase
MNLTIREIEQKDNKALADIIRQVFIEFNIPKEGTVYSDSTTDNLYELFQDKKSCYYVAEADGILVGGCGVYPTDGLPVGYAELVKFYLSPAARGKGIGNMLMQKSIEKARELGYTHLYLESFGALSKAVGMYEKAGFASIPNSLGNSMHYACTTWMVKEL